jgi:hypothetical protein
MSLNHFKYRINDTFSKHKHFLYPIALLLIFRYLYNNYNITDEEKDHINNYKLVQTYLLNDSSLAQSKKPIIWLHMTYEKNARWWPSFSSRNTDDLNQPYLYLTMKTIIDKCGNDFNVCLIDDESFSNILPGWNIDLSIIADPIKTKIRQLGLARILYNYGGFLMPSSFICFQNVASIYDTFTENNKMFVGEMISRNGVSDKMDYFPDTIFMGCKKECPMMSKYINHLEIIVSTDFTSESQFVGSIGRWCFEQITNNEINMISADILGMKDEKGEQVTLDILMSNNFINLSNKVQGLYIPADEILRRTAYQWFARLSARQALESDTMIGKYLLINR